MTSKQKRSDLRAKGADDFDSGLPITAYYNIRNTSQYGYKRLSESARSQYEIGYRDRRDELRKTARGMSVAELTRAIQTNGIYLTGFLLVARQRLDSLS